MDYKIGVEFLVMCRSFTAFPVIFTDKSNNNFLMRTFMGTLSKSIFMAAGMLVAVASFSQTPAPATPATGAVTALCNDGASYSGESKRGACSGHKGIKDWYGSKMVAPVTPVPAAAPAPAPVPQYKVAPVPPSKVAPVQQQATAAGGGLGKVWVNSKSNTYHCQGSKWYGKTKTGEYMSEADAKAKGNHADHGKACS
jgi:hypothetical protein